MANRKFVRCVQCGAEYLSDQTFTQLTDERGEFLPENQQRKLPMMHMDDPARPVCRGCQPVARPTARRQEQVHDAVVLPELSDLVVVADKPGRQPKHRASTKPARASRPTRSRSVSKMAAANVTPASKINSSLGDQLRIMQERLDILPQPQKGQISRYVSPEQGKARFEIVDPPQAEVIRLVNAGTDHGLDRAYALTGRRIPEVPLGLAPTAGPAKSAQDSQTRIEDHHHEEVVEEFAGLAVPDLDWEFRETTRPSGLNGPSQSIQWLVDRQVLIMARKDPDYLKRLEEFRDYLRAQDIQ